MISVIVPAYNDGEYISECLDSILSQEGVTVEIIAVDDGSTDDTRNIIDDYASRNSCIKVYSIDHKGPSAARNLALEHCAGDWITMVDGDDLLLPGALKRMLDTALANPAVDMVMGRFCEIYDKAPIPTYKSFTKFFYGDQTAEIMMYKNRYVDIVNSSACGKLYRSKLWRCERFKTGMLYEDLEVMPRISFSVKQVVIIGDCVYGYRRNPSGIIHTFDRSHTDMLEATAGLCKFFAHEPKLLRAAQSRHFSALFNMLLRISSNRLAMPEVEARCRKELRVLASHQLFARYVRLKNRIGAILQYFPFIFKFPRFCKMFVTK